MPPRRPPARVRLDLRRGQLLRGKQPVRLRPKTWSVLLYLAERPGILVSKEALLDALWPDVAVTEETSASRSASCARRSVTTAGRRASSRP
ncbi:MAG: winged helix-turn-helix domain-containing protein [Candidatus Binatia bacterium]